MLLVFLQGDGLKVTFTTNRQRLLAHQAGQAFAQGAFVDLLWLCLSQSSYSSFAFICLTVLSWQLWHQCITKGRAFASIVFLPLSKLPAFCGVLFLCR